MSRTPWDTPRELIESLSRVGQLDHDEAVARLHLAFLTTRQPDGFFPYDPLRAYDVAVEERELAARWPAFIAGYTVASEAAAEVARRHLEPLVHKRTKRRWWWRFSSDRRHGSQLTGGPVSTQGPRDGRD